jgi:hypothetical protein
MHKGKTSRVMAADGPYGEFCYFYSFSPEYFGQTLVFTHAITLANNGCNENYADKMYLIGMLDTEDEGTTILRNARTTGPTDTASMPDGWNIKLQVTYET